MFRAADRLRFRARAIERSILVLDRGSVGFF